MNKFPSLFNPNQIGTNLKSLLVDECLQLIRKDIYLYTLVHIETDDFYEFSKFFDKYGLNNVNEEVNEEVKNTIMKELRDLEWVVTYLPEVDCMLISRP